MDSNWKHTFRHWWDMLVEFLSITEKRHIFLLAAGIAFNQLLCMIPMILLAIAVASNLLDAESTKAVVTEVLQQLLPENTKAAEATTVVVHELGVVFNYSNIAGWIAGFALIWLASALFGSMRTGLNAIFHAPTPRFFIVYKIKDLLLTLIVTVLVIATTIVLPLLSLLEHWWFEVLTAYNWLWLHAISMRVISMAVTSVLFLVLYKAVPNARLPWRVVLFSTGFAVVLWEIARVVFTWYVNSATTLSKFYGGFLAIASLALWFYYSSLIFLVSAELAQYIHTRLTLNKAPDV